MPAQKNTGEFECDICGKRFEQNRYLGSHKKATHGIAGTKSSNLRTRKLGVSDMTVTSGNGSVSTRDDILVETHAMQSIAKILADMEDSSVERVLIFFASRYGVLPGTKKPAPKVTAPAE